MSEGNTMSGKGWRLFGGCELNREYMALAARRLTRAALQERLEL